MLVSAPTLGCLCDQAAGRRVSKREALGHREVVEHALTDRYRNASANPVGVQHGLLNLVRQSGALEVMEQVSPQVPLGGREGGPSGGSVFFRDQRSGPRHQVEMPVLWVWSPPNEEVERHVVKLDAVGARDRTVPVRCRFGRPRSRQQTGAQQRPNRLKCVVEVGAPQPGDHVDRHGGVFGKDGQLPEPLRQPGLR
jgi:hypothetical protein